MKGNMKIRMNKDQRMALNALAQQNKRSFSSLVEDAIQPYIKGYVQLPKVPEVNTPDVGISIDVNTFEAAKALSAEAGLPMNTALVVMLQNFLERQSSI